MGEAIDWGSQFYETKSSEEKLGEFLQRASTELEPLHITDDIRDRLRLAGVGIRGATYFSDLYSKDETISLEDRIRSVFIGSVAHGHLDLANEAYSFLTAQTDPQSVDEYLVRRLKRAQGEERYTRNWTRLERLEGATKALGGPLSQRILGGIATGFAKNLGKP